jgi:hypothetical protein
MKIVLLISTTLFLASCTLPQGTVSVHAVNEQNRLDSPLVKASNLLTDPKTIFKSEVDGGTNGEDVFTIYLTDAYLKYLKDVGGVNEVLIVAEFTEVVTGKPDDSIVKILGPYNNVADGVKAPFLNKALYGPKKMQSDLLTMTITVYEYDLEENDNNAAMLEFIAGSASALSLADPITTSEIKIAKEIAQTLVRTNENDIVLSMELDFVAGNNKYKPYSKSKVLPLRDGELFLVKQEACRPGTCYDYFGKNAVPGYITDTFMFLPTMIARATTDIPNNDALKAFDDNKVNVSDEGLVLNAKDDETDSDSDSDSDKLFTGKTWLRLNVIKGGDPSQWEIRKILYPTEESLNNLLKNPNSLNIQNMVALTGRLENIQAKIIEAQSDIKVTSVTSKNGIHFIPPTAANSVLCLEHSPAITLDASSARLNGIANVANPTVASASKNSQCFTLDPNSSFTTSKGEFQINYTLNEKSKSKFFPVEVSPIIGTGDFASSSCRALDKSGYELTVTDTKNKAGQITSILVNKEATMYEQKGAAIILKSTSKNPTLTIKGVMSGSGSVVVNTCN